MCTAALDLTDALQRVHRAADVVRGDDPLDVARLAVDDHELRGVAERGVDHRVLDARRDRARPVDAVLALVVDADPAAVGRARPGTRRRPRPRP